MGNNFNDIARVQNIVKSFGDVVAVSDSSFTIENGSIMGFLGPNGSGKTTSIRMLLGLLKPESGSVTLFGQNPFNNHKIKNRLGYIPEEYAFPRWMKAEEYLINLARFNLPREIAIRRARDVLEEMQLTEVAQKRIVQFSKGMKQRMKIGQALIHKPSLIIGDEPFNGLDPVLRKRMFEIIRGYQETDDMTFFISSHILFEVENLANKIILLYKGRTIAQGSAKRIREMIADQPHEIMITSESVKPLANLLINSTDEKTISGLKFARNFNDEEQLIISTLNPRAFYSLLTDLVVEHEITLNELRATDEGLENLFKSLTVG
ncbi:MAG: putative ABC transporter ATP-binding protein YxlF [Candidatus Heimdallarchaeota archaeon LC_2]|nr:MAG: putative ABC transporter ATP-binding protein YxlF [Candidatus Heimdallarchaeota archaeon LC_2]